MTHKGKYSSANLTKEMYFYLNIMFFKMLVAIYLKITPYLVPAAVC
jgi:hypothetical protein